jgi:hypothetical protein
MAYRNTLLFFVLIALVLALISVVIDASPAAAKANLQYFSGEAVWFYRSCSTGKSGTIANWIVELNQRVKDQSSMIFQVNNTYPGYQLACELYFANSGKVPVSVKEVTLYNPNPGELTLSAGIAPGEQKKIIQPCGFKPTWGRNPANLPSSCQSKLKLVLTIGQRASENSRMEFAVQVRLEERPGQHR